MNTRPAYTCSYHMTQKLVCKRSLIIYQKIELYIAFIKYAFHPCKLSLFCIIFIRCFNYNESIYIFKIEICTLFFFHFIIIACILPWCHCHYCGDCRQNLPKKVLKILLKSKIAKQTNFFPQENAFDILCRYVGVTQ